jgi:hypothetical protein
MTKEKVLKLCRKYLKRGYIIQTVILDVFDNGEEIPDEIVRLIIRKPYLSPMRVFIMEECYD